MDRLTRKNAELDSLHAYISRSNFDADRIVAIMRKCADYENTGLSPEHCAELESELEQIKSERKLAIEFIAKLVNLCNPPKDWEEKLFRRFVPGCGDYMGSGHHFLDAYYRIWDEFDNSASDEFYHAVVDEINRLREEGGTSFGGQT